MTEEQTAASLRAKKDGLERAGKAAKAGWPGLSKPGYISWQSSRPDTAHCKVCGAQLMRSGQRLPNYREVQISFTDKSSHITQVCATCAATGFTLQVLEALYCADLLALAHEEEMQETLMHWELMSYRRINGFEGL